MKIIDANVLLYAKNADSLQHERCRSWLEGALNGNELVGFPWNVLLVFLRLSTKPQIFLSPLTPSGAVERVRLWLSAPTATIVTPGDRHLEVMESLLVGAGYRREPHFRRAPRRACHRARRRVGLLRCRLQPFLRSHTHGSNDGMNAAFRVSGFKQKCNQTSWLPLTRLPEPRAVQFVSEHSDHR
jgi:toxin-antitoxin system PIN domain toxin